MKRVLLAVAVCIYSYQFFWRHWLFKLCLVRTVDVSIQTALMYFHQLNFNEERLIKTYSVVFVYLLSQSNVLLPIRHAF